MNIYEIDLPKAPPKVKLPKFSDHHTEILAINNFKGFHTETKQYQNKIEEYNLLVTMYSKVLESSNYEVYLKTIKGCI